MEQKFCKICKGRKCEPKILYQVKVKTSDKEQPFQVRKAVKNSGKFMWDHHKALLEGVSANHKTIAETSMKA